MKKLRGKHTTIIDGAAQVVKALKRDGQIQIAYGLISTGLPTGQHLVKIKQLSGGVQLIYRATRTKQVIYLYGDGERTARVVTEILRKLKIKII